MPVMGVPLALIIVTVMTEVPFFGMTFGLKLFIAVGALTTKSVAEAAEPVPALVVVILPVLFKKEPAAVPWTFTVTVQLPDAGMVPPERLSVLPPLAAVTAPPQVVVAGDVLVSFTRPDGYVSVKATPVIAVALEFVSVTVMVELLLIRIVSGLKFLVAAGGASAVSVAVAAVPGNVLAAVIAPVLFVWMPAVVAVTGTTMEQLPDADIVPPERASDEPPLVIVTVPPQVLDDGVAAVLIIADG